ENINSLFEKYQVPKKFDLLAIDVDYNDFHIWQAINSKYSPSVVVIRYNALHFPNEDKVVKYLPFFCGDATNYFGAGILPLYRLGRLKGFSLVYANGFQLFFVREDLLQGKDWHFNDINDVEKIYRFPEGREGLDLERALDSRSRLFLTFDE